MKCSRALASGTMTPDPSSASEGPVNRIATWIFVAAVALGTSACQRNRVSFRGCLFRHTHVSRTVQTKAKPSSGKETAPESQEAPKEPVELSTPEMTWYPWIKNASEGRPVAQMLLRQRFVNPPGYQRIAVSPETFGEWLRFLPLAAPGTTVTDASGKTSIVSLGGFAAAVMAIDMHAEESADALLRLHAEWQFYKGGSSTINYASNSGKMMPFSRWLSGERIVTKKQDWHWVFKAPAASSPSYADLRSFLDAAYQWTDPRALAIQGRILDSTDVAPGDYFVHSGKDPALVIVLDVAKNAKGEPAMLLGHVAAPHQNMYVMQASKDGAWFMPHADREIAVPGLKPFVWREHRRLPPAMIGKPY